MYSFLFLLTRKGQQKESTYPLLLPLIGSLFVCSTSFCNSTPIPTPTHKQIISITYEQHPMNQRYDPTTSQLEKNQQLDLPQEADVSQEELPRLEWDFSLLASIPSSSSLLASDSIGSITFSPCNSNSTYDSLLATAGIARKIRIYTLNSLIECEAQSRPSVSISTPAKLSNVRFRSCHVIGAGDNDGVVTEYDVTCGTAIYERDEHGGRRIWSIDYSSNGFLAASGSDDCTVHLWDARANSNTLFETIPFTSAVCCVEFDPSGEPFFAVGCADKKAYVYDVRMVKQGPAKVLDRHTRPVTYVRFAGQGQLVSSGADGRHVLWEWSNGQCVREYMGHMSSRSFVGMGVWMDGGLVASGSESNEVFVYDLRWGRPVWIEGFDEHVHTDADIGDTRRNCGFVSAVSWRQGTGNGTGHENGVLVAGDTDGVLKVFGCKRREQGE